jgi:hypothetical protein
MKSKTGIEIPNGIARRCGQIARLLREASSTTRAKLDKAIRPAGAFTFSHDDGAAVREAEALREAASGSAHAPLTRKKYVAQARLVDDPRRPSKTLGMNTEDDVPVESFLDDLERKQSLKSVMGGGSQEALRVFRNQLRKYMDAVKRKKALHSVMGDEAEGFPGGDPALEDQAAKPDVNYRYGGNSEQRCENCRAFDAPSGCVKVSGIIRKIDVCDLFEAARSLEALRVFRSNMRKYPR